MGKRTTMAPLLTERDGRIATAAVDASGRCANCGAAPCRPGGRFCTVCGVRRPALAKGGAR